MSSAPPPGFQPPYQPQYQAQYGGRVAEHPQGTTVMVLGILSLVACGLLGPFAWSMGQKAIREMDADPGTNYTNRGSVNVGRICGIIASCLLIVAAVILVIALIVAAGASD